MDMHRYPKKKTLQIYLTVKKNKNEKLRPIYMQVKNNF